MFAVMSPAPARRGPGTTTRNAAGSGGRGFDPVAHLDEPGSRPGTWASNSTPIPRQDQWSTPANLIKATGA